MSKGVTSPLAGIALMNATIFSVYGRSLQYLSPEYAINHWWAGCAAGLAQSVIISPVELIKTQMQIQGIGKSDMKNYRGWTGTCRHIIKHSGEISGNLRNNFIITSRIFWFQKRF